MGGGGETVLSEREFPGAESNRNPTKLGRKPIVKCQGELQH